MRKLLLVFLLGLSCVSLSQTNQALWAKLKGLPPGQKFQITDTNSKKHSGTLVSVSDTTIVYADSTGQHSIDQPDVRTVKLMKTRNRHDTLVGLAVGGAVGAAVGAGIAVATYKGCASGTFCLDFVSRGELAAVGAGAGLAVGGVTGALIGYMAPHHSTIYNASSH